MTMTRQTILASRPAAMVLALTLVAGLSAPFLMLPHAKAATALSCSENNHNGCTELSPTPPQDTVAVPPNIVLMLDDSGSMKSDYMPDFSYLKNNSNNNALIDAANNGVYYDPTVTYLPPPKADSTTAAPDTYATQTDMTNVPQDGFGAQNPGISVNLYTYNGSYECGDSDNCGGTNGKIKFNASNTVSVPATLQYDQTVNAVYAQKCVSGSPSGGQTGCKYNGGKNNSGHYANVLTEAADAVCTDTFNSNNGITGTLVFTGRDKDSSGNYWTDGECQFSYKGTSTTTYNFFQYSTGPAAGSYTVYYVAPASQGCGTQPNCVVDTDTSGTAAPAGVTVGTNVANWFAYYHTRILMAKSGLMSAFLNLSADYRFGFGSINGRNNTSLPSPTGTYGQNSNKIAQVQPFGDGSSGTRKAAFWNWVATVVPGNSTPLRRSLQGVGAYYSSNDTSTPSGNAWDTMSSDPGYTAGSTTQYACRASYAILTTDGFWNGSDPTAPSGMIGAAGTNGPTYTPPAGKTYTTTGYVAQAPFSGGGASGGVASLADVATYYWETDLNISLANEVAPSTADPAFWQHMTTFTMGLGFDPTGISPSGTTIPQIFTWAQGGSSISGFGWPTPSSNNIYNIADLAHAAVNGHGDFFSAKSPQALAAGFSSAIAQISARNVAPTTAAVNASVVTAGALSFSTGYNTGDWSGTFWAVTINSDGTVNTNAAWKAETSLNSSFHTATGTTNYSTRKVYTDAYTLATDASGNVTSATFNDGFQFTSANAASLDSIQTAGLESPALAGGNDTLAYRINFLLGDPTYEDGKTYRTRNSLLGAIIRSQPVYVSYASSGYYDNWPSGSAEIATGAQTYDAFVTQESTRAGTAYVGANDGMLHAFAAPAPTCTSPTNCTYGNGGTELWAFIPRAVYANLGNLTSTSFSYRPTVDETPVTRDVFFSDTKWHTILAGGVGLGGRGVYALDITDPTSFSASNVLWEFDSDMTIPSTDKCQSIMGSSADSIGCRATDLGYTVSQPNIGRLHNGEWAVLVPNGYFPDCGTPDTPTNNATNCKAIAAQAPKDASGNPYSALFVLNAETGSVIAELKTPTDITGVTSFGLATPVMGDYDNDQVDDVAFAGDVQGNLWRFDLSSSSPSSWTVTLVYKGLADASGNQGVQPITTMPRLFPDPGTNRFMVEFGTGKFLGIGDNSDNTVQAVMGVRDIAGTTFTQTDLSQRYLHETTIPAGAKLPDGSADPNAGATLRCVTGGASDACDSTATQVGSIPAVGSTGGGGWVINLCAATGGPCGSSGAAQTDAGERVVVSPGAIFASNTVVFETLITGEAASDPCSPQTHGAIMVLDAGTGGAAGVSSLGGWPYVGGRISNARTSGSLPIVSSLGGGQAYLPGTTLAPSGTKPLSIDAPIWRRRSWSEINQNQ